jgi:hypothetical protein
MFSALTLTIVDAQARVMASVVAAGTYTLGR